MNKKNKRINCVKDFEKFLVNENIYNDEILTEGAIIRAAKNLARTAGPTIKNKAIQSWPTFRNAAIQTVKHPIDTAGKITPDFVKNLFSRVTNDPVKKASIDAQLVNLRSTLENLKKVALDKISKQTKPLQIKLKQLKAERDQLDKILSKSENAVQRKRFNELVSTISKLEDQILKKTESINSQLNIELAPIQSQINTLLGTLTTKRKITVPGRRWVRFLYTKPSSNSSEITKELRALEKSLINANPHERGLILDEINAKKQQLWKLWSADAGRERSILRALGISAGAGGMYGYAATSSEKNKEYNEMMRKLDPNAPKKGFFDTLKATTKYAKDMISMPFNSTKAVSEKFFSLLGAAKTPEDFEKIFSMIYALDLSNIESRKIRKDVLDSMPFLTRLKYFMYEKSKRAKNIVTNATNMPTAAKVGLGAAGLAGGALAANEIRKQIALNKAKVYGCDTIEDPTKKLQCEIMVAKENIKEYKKFLSKCYDSNNPESCVKIYSQKVKDEEAKLANLTNQFNSQNKPKSIATTRPSENKPKKSKKTKSKSKPKKSKEPKRLN